MDHVFYSRRGHDDLGDHYLDCGDLSNALKCYSRARDYCTSAKHVVNMCLNVIKVSNQYINLFWPVTKHTYTFISVVVLVCFRSVCICRIGLMFSVTSTKQKQLRKFQRYIHVIVFKHDCHGQGKWEFRCSFFQTLKKTESLPKILKYVFPREFTSNIRIRKIWVLRIKGCTRAVSYHFLDFEWNFELGDDPIMWSGYCKKLHCICVRSLEGIISSTYLCVENTGNFMLIGMWQPC